MTDTEKTLEQLEAALYAAWDAHQDASVARLEALDAVYEAANAYLDACKAYEEAREGPTR